MLRKITIIAASTVMLTFGGTFAASANAQSVDQQLPYKIYYSINGGQFETLTQETAPVLIKKTLERIQGQFLTNFDLNKIEKFIQVEKKVPAKKAEQPKTEQPKEVVEQPAPEKKQPIKEEKPAQPAPQVPVNESPKESVDEKPVSQPTQPAQPTQPVKQPEQQEQKQQQSALSQFEIQVVELTNQERAKHGLSPLAIDEELSRVAREKSRDMATRGYFDHNSPTYGSPFDMMKAYGIDYRTAGENIAKGQRTPQEVVNAWMNSPGHRANILNGNFTHIGVGFVESGNHWTQMFIGK